MKPIIYLAFTLFLLSSCGTYIAPAYTSMDKMLEVEQGMSRDEVNETLGIKPYNILHKNDSTAVYAYNYRLKERLINNVSPANSEASQTSGKPWFTKPSKLYVLYEQGKFSSLITEKGLQNSDYILLKNNNLMLVSKSDLVDFDLYEGKLNTNPIEQTNLIKTPKDYKHYLLYSSYIPNGALGFKYGFCNKFGGYISGAYSFEWESFSYFTFGMLIRASSKVDIYTGIGAAPSLRYDDYYYGDYLDLDSPALEAGTLININKLTLDTGLGLNFNEGLYVKLGLGFNF